ncbi:hypothetical protein ACFFMN_11960 [Planobispora siamensis]|uniref:Uncharacterized protein n=1 Tax=Planobispora siamensis TaxID=936338 RepID=A0A8J3SDL9_9ACTN|nr:hypothetical protein [Planobispora siamensis]GIH89934.1 hypothetical protein Psi01_05640 [Planobispora siamensis]
MGADDRNERAPAPGSGLSDARIAEYSVRLAQMRDTAEDLVRQAAAIRADGRRNAAIAQEVCRSLAEQRERLRAVFATVHEQRRARLPRPYAPFPIQGDKR